MSGYSSDVMGEGGIIDAGLEFIQKPFPPAALARRVRELLDPD
jgi:DNA-binding response OmpR family regulator